LLALTFAAYGFVRFQYAAILSVVAALSLIEFVRIERRCRYPLLDLDLLKIKEFSGGAIAQFLNAVAWGAFLLTISLYLQLVQGMSPLVAGISLLPFDLAFLLIGPISGRLSDRFGVLPFVTAGLATISLSLFLFSQISPEASYSTIAVLLVVGGAGTGLFASPNMSSIMGSVPPKRRGVGSALRATFFNVGYLLSFNLVILIMTLSVPYSLITQIISSINPVTISSADRAAFAGGLHQAYIVLTIVNTIAIVPSFLRGKRVVSVGASANTELVG